MARKLNDDDIILALITSKSQTEAAKKLGVTKQTITRRVSDPGFKNMYSEYRKNILNNINTQLVNSSQEAVNVLFNLMHSNNEMIQYNACSKVLSLAQDYISMQDIIERLDRLESPKND